MLDDLVDNLDLADHLEQFDERVTQRGWVFDDETSREESLAWFYPPSGTDSDGDVPLTTMWIAAADPDWVYLLLIGTTDGYRFDPDALFEHLDAIEAYRIGDPLPEFS